MASPISEIEIKEGLQKKEFIYFYQPQVSFVTGKMTGVEALVRWKKDSGMVFPDDFIPQAEHSGLISHITKHLISLCCQDSMIIQGAASRPIEISINLSAKDFNDNTITNKLIDLVQKKIINPELLNLEVTESAVLAPSKHILDLFHSLTAVGYKLTMDDYGKAYSNLSNLAQWPFSCIKLDKEFIDGMTETKKHATIVGATIRMAHELGFTSVAEGIETEKTFEALLHAGCAKAQGYWIAKPMPLEELLLFIKQDKQWPANPIGLLKMVQHDHIQWRNEIIQVVTEILVQGHVGERVSIPALEHTRCRLGKWFYGLGQQFSHHPSFLAIEKPHTELHKVGKELVDLAHTTDDKEQIIEMTRKLACISGEVLTHLQQLEHEIMIETTFLR